jgi:sarcosine oxidase, subunit beta
MITILGGGVAGAALARALAVRGYREVVVFDPRPAASGSTGRATGGFRTQFTGKLNIALSLASRPFFITRAECIRFQPTGYLYLAEESVAAEELRRRAQLQVAAGLPITHPEPASLLPFFDTAGISAANYCPLDGTYYPPSILHLLIEEAREAGAEFRYECEAQPHDLEAEIVVIACGIWSRQVGASLGVQLPVEPVERGVFQVKPVTALPHNVPFTIGVDAGWSLRERDGRLLVKFPGDPHDWEPIRAWLAQHIPAAAVDQPEDHWTGCYEMTPDQHPLVGETERSGVWATCGFSGHGVMHAPAVAESLAAMILGQTPPVDISSLSPLRKEPLVDFTQM